MTNKRKSEHKPVRKKGKRPKDYKAPPVSPPQLRAYDPEDLAANRKPLTTKQALFVTELLRDGNQKEAAVRAGVPEEMASSQAWAWLNDHDKYGHVQEAVRRGFLEKRQTCRIDAQDVVRELATISFLDIREAFDPETGLPLPIPKLPAHVAAAVKRIKVSFKENFHRDEDGDPAPETLTIIDMEFHDKLTALKQIAQHLGLLKESDHYHQHVHLDWGALFNRKPPEVIEQHDIVDQKLKAVERLALPQGQKCEGEKDAEG